MKNILLVVICFGLLVLRVGPVAALDVNQYPALVNLVNTMSTKDGYPKDELLSVLSSAQGRSKDN